jgi:excisionase family DNA binding protein
MRSRAHRERLTQERAAAPVAGERPPEPPATGRQTDAPEFGKSPGRRRPRDDHHGKPEPPAAAAPAPLLVDTREAARLLAVSPRTLWTWTHAHELPHYRIPGRGRRGVLRYDPAAMRAWLDGARP